MDRYLRQVRLAGVGADGQARVGRAIVDVPGAGLPAAIAARYLAGAGVGGLRLADPAAARAAREVNASVSVEPGPAPLGALAAAPAEVHDPVARELASGALTALLALRAILATAREGGAGER